MTAEGEALRAECGGCCVLLRSIQPTALLYRASGKHGGPQSFFPVRGAACMCIVHVWRAYSQIKEGNLRSFLGNDGRVILKVGELDGLELLYVHGPQHVFGRLVEPLEVERLLRLLRLVQPYRVEEEVAHRRREHVEQVELLGVLVFVAPGVERVFSAAGKMHGDLQKSAKDTTLEHSLFAAFNTE